ncbi:MAG: prepilin-type N-terminal cleavage/methylation domain-containing protein [Candidatus Paceibacterota bacterium]|jgi:prepilin-type N-terminal cleavage/methylation domain-containing protein
MIKKLNKQEGFSLVEVILAISIFALSVMGLTGGLIYGRQSTVNASHREQAVFLADEGLEASQNIALENFNNLVSGSFGLAVQNNLYVFNGISDISGIYERQIVISEIDANTKKVTSLVSWSQGATEAGQVSLVTYITDWK